MSKFKNLIVLLLVVASIVFYYALEKSAIFTQAPTASIVVPIEGNTWANPTTYTSDTSSKAVLIEQWNKNEITFDTYVYIDQPGEIKLYATAKSGRTPSKITVRIDQQEKELSIATTNYKKLLVGSYTIESKGYVKIQTTGSFDQKDQSISIDNFVLEGEIVKRNTAFVQDNLDNMAYWGRRGPSTHLNYKVTTSTDIVYYYNEITVPKDNDVVGSYYMATGFKGGYFGMQVNSQTERRILFSVWSPFVTDDPNAIPEEQKIVLLKKSDDVVTGEFGNEGSGGQSFLRYNWQAGQTYKFLLKGSPSKNNYTTYTAWFWADELQSWKLIASFDRPQTNSYLTGFHSFLENFIPEQGTIQREVAFNNPWVMDTQGQWHEITELSFSADNTARKGYRLDYGGGVKNNTFFLRNCGFFSPHTEIGSTFQRTATANKPTVEIDLLP